MNETAIRRGIDEHEGTIDEKGKRNLPERILGVRAMGKEGSQWVKGSIDDKDVG